MAELNLLREIEHRNPIGEWVLRGGVAIFFLIFGLEKFSSTPGSHWVVLFQQIGAGVWFRYFTGVVETLGAVLVLIPRTTLIGIGLIACAMVGAVAVLAFVIHEPSSSFVPGIFLVGVLAVGFRLRRD